MLRRIVVSLLIVGFIWTIAVVLFAIAGHGLALGQPSPTALARFQLLFGTILIALIAFSVTRVFGGIFEWRHTAKVAWISLGIAGASWLVAAVSPMH